MNEESKLIDTNILVYAYDISEKAKRRIARTLVDEIWKEGGGIVTLQNLAEFFIVVTRKVENPIPPSNARIILADILRSRHWVVVDRRAETLLKATELVEHNKAPFWDALIAACMLENGIHIIVTENERDFARIPGITVINPFKKARLA